MRSPSFNVGCEPAQVVLLPLDVLKIKKQTNPEAFARLAASTSRPPAASSLASLTSTAAFTTTAAPAAAAAAPTAIYPSSAASLFPSASSSSAPAVKPRQASLLQQLRFVGFRTLYSGTCVTMTRNALGSSALFGTNALVKRALSNNSNSSGGSGKGGKGQSFLQTAVSSSVGSIASLVVSSPFDVVKTRVQNKNFDQVGLLAIVLFLCARGSCTGFGSQVVTARQVAAQLLREEPVSALFKGLGVKCLTVSSNSCSLKSFSNLSFLLKSHSNFCFAPSLTDWSQGRLQLLRGASDH